MSEHTPPPSGTLGQLLDTAVERWPDHEAFVWPDRGGHRQTWRQFARQVDQVARGLMALGVESGDRVALWASNVPEWPLVQLATARIGAVLLTINTNFQAEELAYALEQSECQTLVLMPHHRKHDCVRTLFELAPEFQASSPHHSVTCARLPHLHRAVLLAPEAEGAIIAWPDLVARAGSVSPAQYQDRQRTVTPDSIATMQYTSGTTGMPKGAMLTHRNILIDSYWVGVRQRLSERDRMALPVPLFHCAGCVMGTLTVMHFGAALLVMESFHPLTLLQAVQDEHCTAINGVPTMYMAMLHHERFDEFDVSSLRTGNIGASICPQSLMEQVMTRLHMPQITTCYGLTEASPIITQTRIDDPPQRRLDSVGQPLPGAEIRIVEPESGQVLPPHKAGEVVCRGFGVMAGYYNMPEATALALDSDGWLHTGDLGYVDEEGFLFITGRIKDVIIRGGENIAPREVEDLLRHMDGVLDVQVVGVPSEFYGEEVAAFFMVRDGVTVTPITVEAFCRDHLSWHKIPRYITTIKAWPLTSSGKIKKFRLREMAAELFAGQTTRG